MKKLFVAFTILMVASPALAVEWNFFGSARMQTWWIDTDLGDAALANGDDDDADLVWDLDSTSRIGAKVRADAVRGEFELGLKGSSSGDVDVGTRIMTGTWKFGPGSLKVGKDYTPVHQFISGQASNEDLGLLGVGTMYGERVGLISLSFGGFEIAAVTPFNPDLKQAGNDRDEWLPKLEALFGMSFDMFNFNLLGGYQILKEENATDSFDIASWTVGGDAGVTFGPVYFKGAISYSQNAGDAGWHIDGLVTDGATSTINTAGDDVDDVNTLMYALVGGFTFNENIWIEAGFGWREDSYDAPGAEDDDAWSAYVQLPVQMAPGVWIIPEFSYYEFDENSAGTDVGSQWWLGGKWQIDF